MKTFIKRFDLSVERITLRLFAAWLTLNYILLNTLADAESVGFTSVKYASDINLTHYFLTVLALFFLLSVLDYVTKSFNSDAFVLLVSMLGIAFSTVGEFENFYYAFFILIPIGAVLAWLIYTNKLSMPKFFSKARIRFPRFFQAKDQKDLRKM
ncbi:MAG: hypothetical protein E7648_05225 [Ruminococcaceae bacterium]|nr:hypothetical protein [Oscillospiraceae bacterium]